MTDAQRIDGDDYTYWWQLANQAGAFDFGALSTDNPSLTLCSSNGKLQFDQQIHLQLPTYKQEFDVTGGYHNEKGRPPKPLGGAWLTFYYDGSARFQRGMSNGIRYKTDWAE